MLRLLIVASSQLVLVAAAHAGETSDAFAITLKQTVSNGVPGPGAGNIEAAGHTDVYTFTADLGTVVFFDELSASSCTLQWKCAAPDASLLFTNNALCVGDPGSFTIDQAGTYTITAFATGLNTGTYSFTLLEVNPTDVFPIGLKQIVSNGVPGPGAGNIEEAGTMDQYTFSVAPATAVYFDEIDADNCSLLWTCEAPDGSLLFTNNALCVGDPGSFTIDQAGVYTITAFGTGSNTGTYSFTLWEVNPTDVFAIALEETISSGVPRPGAGMIEEPGATDQYTFTAFAGSVVFFDELAAANCTLQWSCHAPDGAALFLNDPLCVSDPGELTLPLTGQYTITVAGAGGATGAYSFVLHAVIAPQVFEIELGDTVSLDNPAPGAGHIEEVGAVDIYLVEALADQQVCFLGLDGGCSLTWNAVDPADERLFTDLALCSTDPGLFTLPLDGLYVIIVQGQGDATGTYSFQLGPPVFGDLDGDCAVNGADLGSLLLAWGDCPRGGACPADFNDDGEVNGADLGMLLLNWTG